MRINGMKVLRMAFPVLPRSESPAPYQGDFKKRCVSPKLEELKVVGTLRVP